MKALWLGMLFMSSLSFAGTLEQDIKKLSELVDVGTNGGEAYIYTYDVNTFKYDPLVKELLESIEGDDCKFTPIIGRRDMMNNYSNMAIFFRQYQAQRLLKKLYQTNKIKAATGFAWDGSEGDSEYCSREDLDIYFINGTVLRITHDSTT